MTLGTFLLIFTFSLLGILLIYYIVFPVYKKHRAIQSKKNTSKEPINFIDRSFFYSSSNPTETDKPNFASSSSDFFKVWNRDLHNSSDQKRRIKRAIYMDSTCYVNETDISASIQSSRDVFKFYQVCYDKCNCPDFSDRLKPCKHIYRLAFAMGALALSADKTKIYIRNKQSEYEFFMNNEEAEKTRTYVKTIDFPSKKHSNHSPQYYDFEYKYYDKILKKVDKAESILVDTIDFVDPNAILRRYEKCFNEFKNIEQLCYELGGEDGREFFHEEFAGRLDYINKEYSYFKEYTYDEMLAEYKASHKVESTKPKVSIDGIMCEEVYVSSSGKGKRFHCDKFCANPNGEVITLAIEDAKRLHFYPCSKCFHQQ